MKIFAGHKDIFEKVPDTFSRKQEHLVLFSTLNLIFTKTRLARFLSPEEIADLESNIVNLSTVISLKFSHRKVVINNHKVNLIKRGRGEAVTQNQ